MKKALIAITMLMMLASCASKPKNSDFYIGCFGGMIMRDALDNGTINKQKADLFKNICQNMDDFYQNQTKKNKVEFPKLEFKQPERQSPTKWTHY
jgi:hypothetical protein